MSRDTRKYLKFGSVAVLILTIPRLSRLDCCADQQELLRVHQGTAWNGGLLNPPGGYARLEMSSMVRSGS